MQRGFGFQNRRNDLFYPGDLFLGSTVQGAWYDPSDLTTLFQDSAGTTPVTAVEQPVGLMLDKSKGLVLGSELVTNGDFSQGTTGWTDITGAWAVTGGALAGTAVAANAFGPYSNATSVVAGQFYQATFTITVTSGSLFTRVGNDQSSAYTTSGTYTRIFNAITTGVTVFQVRAGGSGFTGTIDNISVKALPGNHAFQTTSASRPTLRARYNLLTYSEQFENAAWGKTRCSITPNATIAPDGTLTADKWVEDNSVSNSRWVQTGSGVRPDGITTFTVFAKSAERSWLGLSLTNANTQPYAFFDLVNGVVGTIGSSGGTITTTAAITPVGNGWYRCSVSWGVSVSGIALIFGSTADNTFSYTGNGTSGIFIWGAQLTQTAVFPTNVYQRVGAATDYATGAAFPPYLFFDGTDDSMLTNSVDFATVTSDGQARRNLLSNPTQFDVSTVWLQSDVTVSANAVVAPDGSSTADSVIEAATNAIHRIYETYTVTASQVVTASVYARANGSRRLYLNVVAIAGAGALFDLTGSGAVIATSGTAVNLAARISAAGGGWYRCEVTGTGTGAANNFYCQINRDTSVTAADDTYLGNGTSGLFLWGAQLETGSTATAFQNIGTDKMLVVAGVTKQSDAATGMLAELSAIASGSNGSFAFYNLSGAASYYSILQGTATLTTGYTTFAAPITNVAAFSYNIAGATSSSEVSAKFNGVTTAPSSTAGSDAGTGNFGNYPLYIGRRNNASLPFNGNIYSLIIAGQSYSSGQISSTESWVAAKTPLGTI